MPDPDLSAVAKWPNVPACYGWLSLDRRGRWRLKGEPVTHAGLIAFINRQYGSNERGEWFLQNGPQRVFVTLDYTPWVWRLAGEKLIAHTGEAAGDATAVFVDEEGSILIATALGAGLLDDRDLPSFLAACRLADGTPASDGHLMATMAGQTGVLWYGLPITLLRTAAVPERFAFEPNPQP